MSYQDIQGETNGTVQSWERQIYPTEFASLFYDNGSGWSATYTAYSPATEHSFQVGRQSGGGGAFEAKMTYWDTSEFLANLPDGAVRGASYFRFAWSVDEWSTIWPASLSGDIRTTNTRPANSADVHAAIDDTTFTMNASGNTFDWLVPMGDVSTWSTGGIFGFTLGQVYEPEFEVEESWLAARANDGPELAVRWAVMPRPGVALVHTDQWVFHVRSQLDWKLAYVIQYQIDTATAAPPVTTPIYHTAKLMRAANRQPPLIVGTNPR